VCLFPVEIWNPIFAQACDPRGKVAAAISQVSRYFYQVIGPYRFASLVIYGESQIVAFHEAMEVMPPNVPRAKHLYIGFIPESRVAATRPVCDAVIEGWIQHREETETQRDDRTNQNSTLSNFGMYPQEYDSIQGVAVAGIIFQHRGTLETLTYLTPVSYVNFEMFGCLSSLRDLTVVCLCYKSTFYEIHHSNPLHRQTQFPSLERLHLSYFDTKPLFDHNEFRRVAPKLTHLRLSGRKCFPQFEKLLPDTKVLVQVILLSSQEQPHQLGWLRRILSTQQYKQRLKLLEPGHREDCRYGFFDALLDWLDVSTGGNAFWGDSDQVTIDELAAR